MNRPLDEVAQKSSPSPERQSWLAYRQEEEARAFNKPGMRLFQVFYRNMLRTLLFTLRVTGLMERGLDNARAPRLRPLDLTLQGLPAPFDGYRVLHLSDLHLPVIPFATERIIELARHEAVDLVVITGDIGHWLHPLSEASAKLLGRLRRELSPVDGFVAVLGNHDHSSSAALLEAMGMLVLINESLHLQRGEASLRITGIDDVHFFRTRHSTACLSAPVEGFAVALVHSPEIANVAAAAGYGLYLTGHTHGGQVRIPGLPPLWGALKSHFGLVHGVWRLGKMVGYTSAGVGSSQPPVRFNCPPEAVLLTLRCAQGA